MVRGSNMRAFIYTGGAIDPSNIIERPNDGDIIIAADSGYRNAALMDIRPNILLGDFDSLPREELNDAADGTEVMTVPAEKDFTDTQMAIKVALERGASEIILIGGLGGRLDHTLSNIAILRSLHTSGIRAVITDGRNRVRYMKNDSIILLRSGFKYFSLIALSDRVKGVSLEGCKYPLKNATITANDQYAVSNEIDGNCAFISLKKGEVLIIESNDAK